jgi:hypothetical protein
MVIQRSCVGGVVCSDGHRCVLHSHLACRDMHTPQLGRRQNQRESLAGSRLPHLASLRRRELSGARRLSAPCNIFRLPLGSAGVVVRISATRATRRRLMRSRERLNCSTLSVRSSSAEYEFVMSVVIAPFVASPWVEASNVVSDALQCHV